MQNFPVQVTGGNFTAAEMNEIITELENIITNSGQSLSGADLRQIEKAVSIYAAGGSYYTESGVADAYVCSVVGSKTAPPAYFTGMLIRFRAGNANTGACTVNVSSLGVKNIKLANGSTDPSAGDINTTSDVVAVYDGTSFLLTNIQFERLDVTGAVAIGGNLDVTGNVTVSNTPGATPDINTIYKDNICKGWINFDGTGTISISDSFNVSSIVDNGTGDYTVNWDRDFANTNYCVVGTSQKIVANIRLVGINSQAVGSVNIITTDAAANPADSNPVCILAFGDQ